MSRALVDRGLGPGGVRPLGVPAATVLRDTGAGRRKSQGSARRKPPGVRPGVRGDVAKGGILPPRLELGCIASDPWADARTTRGTARSAEAPATVSHQKGAS